MPSQQMMAGGGGGAVKNGVTFTNEFETGVGVPTALTSTFSSSGGFSSLSDPGDWFVPNSVGIGSQYWAKFTRSSGNVFTQGSEGTWQSLSAGYAVGWTSTTQARSWVGTVQFASDAAGANIVATDNLNMLLSRV